MIESRLGRLLERPRARFLLLGLALAALGGGTWWSVGAAPKLTLTNAGLLFAGTAQAVWGAGLVALGGAGLVAATRGRAARAAAAALGVGLLALSADRALFRLEVGPERLALRDLRGSRMLTWAEVHQVETPPGGMRLADRAGRGLAFSTAAFLPEQRASLERALARHIATAQMPAAPAPAGPPPPP